MSMKGYGRLINLAIWRFDDLSICQFVNLSIWRFEDGYCCRKCGHKKYQDRRKRGRKTVLELIAHRAKRLSLTN